MRKRFPISLHLEFKEALAAKVAARAENPDKHFQVRRYANGFKLVERLETNEAKLIEDMRSGRKAKTKRHKRPSVL